MKLISFLSLILLLSFQTIGQVAGNILYNETNRWRVQNRSTLKNASTQNLNEVRFDISSMYNVRADSYLAIFHITQVGPNARDADSLMRKRINAFRKDAIAAGVDPEGFIIDMLSMVPLYEVEVESRLFSKTYTEIPAGFEIQKNIHIHFKNAQILDDIITSAAINEIYDLVKVDYYVKDVQAIYDTLRMRTTELINKRIEQFGELGIEINGTWTMANDQTGVYFPLDRYESYQAFAYTSLDASRKNPLVKEMKKSKTMYYNKIPYTGYDIIIDPEIIEPAVQFTYSIQIVYEVKKPQPKPKTPEPVVKTEVQTKYVWITEEGEMRELKLK